MDKHEYRTMTEEMLEYAMQGNYQAAMDIADRIDWSKVKNTATLSTVSEIYERNREYQKSRDVLFLAYDRTPESKKIVYRLGSLAIKLGELKEAEDCYEEFASIAPKDPNCFVFRYKLLKAQNAPLQEQIEVLEHLKKAEYVEKWAYELATLYQSAGMTAKCIEECDDLALWFSEGKYVYKALELKKQYKPFTPMQQEKYNLQFVKPQSDAESGVVESAAVESVVEEPAAPVEEPVVEEVEEVQAEEPATELVAEQNVEIADELTEAIEVLDEVKKEASPVAPTLSIEEMLQDWEEKQKENAQMIREEIEKVEAEKAKEEAETPETEEEDTAEEEILPDDIRQLMEELESESESIEAQKTNPELKTADPKTVEVEKTEESQMVASGEEERPVKESIPLVQKVAEKLVAMEVIPPLTPELSDVEALEAVVSHKYEPAPQLDEDTPGIKLGNTDSMAAVAKALKNNVEMDIQEPEGAQEEQAVEASRAPITDPVVEGYDTGFIVQGRYDLEAQSEVGTRAGLTDDQKKLFSYFVPVHGMSEQLVEVLEADKKCKSRYGTSRIGNVLIIGRKGSGKTVLAVNIVKAIQKARKAKAGKVGIVAAESLNKKNVSEILGKLQGGAIIVEKASRLNRKTVEEMCEIMEGQTGELLVVLEDERKPLEELLTAYPQFEKKFTSRLEVPVFINDELVTFGQTYAKENGYKIDEMGILALYTRIDMIQRDERVVTVTDVKSIVDEAIENSQKVNVKKLVKMVFKKNRDDSDRILLKEEDFR